MSIRSLLMVLGLLFSVSCMATTSAVAVEITSLSSGSELDSVLQYSGTEAVTRLLSLSYPVLDHARLPGVSRKPGALCR